MHKRVHETGLREKRGNVLTIRGLSVASRTLGISGQCLPAILKTDTYAKYLKEALKEE